MSKRNIMSYPFAGCDYEQIKEVGSRVRIVSNENDYCVNYLVSFKDPIYGYNQEKSISVVDDDIKNTLCYFYFLNSMCRYNSSITIFKAIDRGLLSYNTYVDSILISVNEIISGCKYGNSKPNYEELLARFGKQYKSDDLNRLHSKSTDYKYLDGLFNYLYDDSYLVHASKFNCEGVFFDKMNDGIISDIVMDVIENKDNEDFFCFSRKNVSGPKLTKKISSSQVI